MFSAVEQEQYIRNRYRDVMQSGSDEEVSRFLRKANSTMYATKMTFETACDVVSLSQYSEFWVWFEGLTSVIQKTLQDTVDRVDKLGYLSTIDMDIDPTEFYCPDDTEGLVIINHDGTITSFIIEYDTTKEQDRWGKNVISLFEKYGVNYKEK